MAVIANENHRLAWLSARLTERRNHIWGLIRRITGLGHPSGLKPSLFSKFLRMLDDVAAAKLEETSLIGRIEEIEQKHRTLRQQNQLKQASSPKPEHLLIKDEECQPPEHSRFGLLKLLIVGYLFSQKPEK